MLSISPLRVFINCELANDACDICCGGTGEFNLGGRGGAGDWTSSVIAARGGGGRGPAVAWTPDRDKSNNISTRFWVMIDEKSEQ